MSASVRLGGDSLWDGTLLRFGKPSFFTLGLTEVINERLHWLGPFGLVFLPVWTVMLCFLVRLSTAFR